MFAIGSETFIAHLKATFINMRPNTCVVDVKRLQHRFKIMRSDLLRKTRSSLRELAAAEAELDRTIR
mgnify:CR=1